LWSIAARHNIRWAGAQQEIAARHEGALARHGKPEIFDSDQGTSSPCSIHRGADQNGIAVSMDGRSA
jgi:hypothetical protein